MTTRSQRVEQFFGRLGQGLIRFRFVTLVVTLLIAVGLGAQMRHLTINTSNEGFLRANDPILLTYNDFRDQFGRDDMLAVAIRSDEIFSVAFLKKLQALHEELLAEVPHVNEITSMVNARNTLGKGDMLLVDDLLADFPETTAQLEELKQRVLANPLYADQLISADGSFTTLVIESDIYSAGEAAEETDLLAGFDDELALPDEEAPPPQYLTDKENEAMVKAVQQVVRKYNGENFQVFIAGTPIVTHTVKQFMMQDMKRFLRLAVVTIGLSLLVMFRRVVGVVYPLLVVAVSLVSTLGLMALCGIQFKTPTIILPSFLLAVGVGASVHVLSLFFQQLRRGESREAAIVIALSHSGLAIVMTSLTTAAGLASFAMAKVAPIGDLGIFSALGVLLALFYTLVLLPALLAITPFRQSATKEEPKQTWLDGMLERVTDFTVNRAIPIVVVAAILIVVAIAGMSQLRFSHNVLNWLPEDLAVRQATETIDENLRGSVVLEVLVDSGRENGLYDRETLLALDRIEKELLTLQDREVFVGKVMSVATIIKEINQALHTNQSDYYRIPDNEKLIPQEFLLFENSGSDDLEDVVDSQFRTARVTIKVPWRDALAYVPFMKDIEQRFVDQFAQIGSSGQPPVQITVTGIMALFGRIIYAAIYSAAQSYTIAIVVITLMMILMIGNLRLGLVSMIPNLGPILAVLGIMGWCDIPLDMFTMLIASIAIGLAVDDTVHFMYNFKRYYLRTDDVRQSVSRTLHTAGRAMLTTSVVLSIGFFIFIFASMNNVFYFGLLTGCAILFALAADFLLAPALMALIVKKNWRSASNMQTTEEIV